jgi:16S rRNA (cytosine1402-N4)-methyltransferase
MDREQVFSALALVNEYSEQALADVLFKYGEERLSRRIARSIVARRPVPTTSALREAVERAVGPRFVVKSLARVFQALRIEVNHELDNLATALAEASALLLPGGRLVVISYHSLEDRIVKEFFRKNSAKTIPSGHKLIPDILTRPLLRLVGRQPITAPDEECRVNPRARSAKLRTAEKV